MSSISSVSSAASAISSLSDVSDLEKQKADLQKQIATETASKDDDKTKDLKVAQYNQQIAQIDAQIAAAQAKASKPDDSSQSTDKKQASKQPDPDPSKFLDTTI